MNNPLLEPSSLPYGAPQFDKIELHHLKEAAIQAAKELRSSIDAINCNPEAATFDNTIKALLFANEKYEIKKFKLKKDLHYKLRSDD